MYLNDTEVESFIREGFYGGRNEIFIPGFNGECWSQDINSAYPYQMITNKFPVGKAIKIYGKPTKLNFGFIYAKVSYYPDKTEKQIIPVLPIYDHVLKKLIWPIGSFTGTWFSEELNYAEQNEYIIERLQGVEYDKSNNLFKRYVDYYYNKKIECSKNKDIPGKYLAKLKLNALYGLLALKSEYIDAEIINNLDITDDPFISNTKPLDDNGNWSLILKHNYASIKGYESAEYKKLFSKKYVISPSVINKINKDNRINSVQVSASITSYARIELHIIMREIICNGGKILYVDTDSIYSTNPINYSRIGNEIGKLSQSKIKEFYASNNKMYSYINEKGELETFAKGLKNNTAIGKLQKQLVKGEISLVISEEILFARKMFVNIFLERKDKQTKLVYSKRNVIKYEPVINKVYQVKITNKGGCTYLIDKEKFSKEWYETSPLIYKNIQVKLKQNLLIKILKLC